MKIIPFEMKTEGEHPSTFEIQLIHLGWCEKDTCLIGGKWYQGVFWWDLYSWWWMRNGLFMVSLA